MMTVLLIFPRYEAHAIRGGLLGARDDWFLEQHVHEDEHRLGLHHQHAGRALRVGVVVLVHGVVGDDSDVAGLPLVADAVVDLKSFAIQDIEDRLVHVEVHLRAPAGRVLFEVQVQRLAEVVLGVEVVLREGLRPIDEVDLVRPPDARQRAEAFEIILQTVLTLNGADEYPVLPVLKRWLRHVFPLQVWSFEGSIAEGIMTDTRPGVEVAKPPTLGASPVIVMRGANARAGVLVNACAHRGTRLVEGPSGNVLRGGFRCIYHMWTYDTEGRLIAVSLPDDFPAEFRKEDYGLPRARVETYKGAIFATLNDAAPPLLDYLAELTGGLDRVLGDGALRFLGSIKVIFRANWKLYVENIYDGYHVTALHTGFQVVRLRSHGGERLVPNYERNGHLWGRSKSTPVNELTPALRDMSLFDTRTKPTTDHNMMVVFPSCAVTVYFDTIQL